MQACGMDRPLRARQPSTAVVPFAARVPFRTPHTRREKEYAWRRNICGAKRNRCSAGTSQRSTKPASRRRTFSMRRFPAAAKVHGAQRSMCGAELLRPSKRECHSNEFGRHEVVTPLSPPHGGRRLSGHGPGAPISRKGRGLERQRVTAPLAVSNVTDRMPGVPCGATHSTATSSSGFSTGSPSHSVTREAEPAMVRQLILRLLW